MVSKAERFDEMLSMMRQWKEDLLRKNGLGSAHSEETRRAMSALLDWFLVGFGDAADLAAHSDKQPKLAKAASLMADSFITLMKHARSMSDDEIDEQRHAIAEQCSAALAPLILGRVEALYAMHARLNRRAEE